jgi:hypothetical protein
VQLAAGVALAGSDPLNGNELHVRPGDAIGHRLELGGRSVGGWNVRLTASSRWHSFLLFLEVSRVAQ